jgi:hypothetical protein
MTDMLDGNEQEICFVDPCVVTCTSMETPKNVAHGKEGEKGDVLRLTGGCGGGQNEDDGDNNNERDFEEKVLHVNDSNEAHDNQMPEVCEDEDEDDDDNNDDGTTSSGEIEATNNNREPELVCDDNNDDADDDDGDSSDDDGSLLSSNASEISKGSRAQRASSCLSSVVEWRQRLNEIIDVLWYDNAW